ncbi:thymidylate kinase, partial [Escherichia coli]|nr:thymidylate kinase [Escherichia coli]
FPPNVEVGRFVSLLASQERKAFHWMSCHKPDLVIKLNVDLEVACSRKPNHKRESLVRQIPLTPHLTFGGAQLVDIHANHPLEKF